jgi:hypothetical protein
MMHDIVLFTKPACKKCDYVKAHIPEELKLTIHDVTSPDGKAEAAYYEVYDKPLPVLVVGNEIIEGAIRIKNKLRDLVCTK